MKRQFTGTIRDVAEKAGVSVSTVSRVLNNNYPVSEEVRKRVLEIVEMVNYKPNSMAKNLRRQKSQMIGLIVADIANLFFMQMAKGVENIVSSNGYNIMIAGSNGDVEKERRLLSAMLEERPAALIITSYDNDRRYLQDFLDTGIAVVMADRYIEGFDCDVVVMDDFNTTYRMTHYLLERGHQNIAIANVILSISSGRERYEGYLKALSEKGLKLNNQFVSSGNFDAESSKSWVKDIFNRENRPTALVCANNVMAIGALMAFRELGLKVPDDVSLVSVGEVPYQELFEPEITISSRDGFYMGERAGLMALDRIKNINQSGYNHIVIESDMLERNSVRDLTNG